LKQTGPVPLIERIEFLKSEKEKVPKISSRLRSERAILDELGRIEVEISELENRLLEAEPEVN
jgi:predicted nuclease with TOPRIM domain